MLLQDPLATGTSGIRSIVHKINVHIKITTLKFALQPRQINNLGKMNN